MATEFYTSAEFAAGLSGPVSYTKNAARIYGEASRTAWVGKITGTTAKLTATSDWGAENGLIRVSVDHGEYVQAPRDGSVYTLFDGEQAERFVVVRFSPGSGTAPYFPSSGNILQVDGDDVDLFVYENWAQLRDGNPLIASSAATKPMVADYSPGYLAAVSGSSNGSNIVSYRIRGALHEIVAVGATLHAYVSIDGAPPIKYTLPTVPNAADVRAVKINGFSGDVKTYNIWSSTTTGAVDTVFSVGSDSDFLGVGPTRQLHQYGDAITSGTGSSGSVTIVGGDVETMEVAARLGFVGSTNGWGAITTAQCAELISRVVPNRVINPDDVAVLAIGRGDNAPVNDYIDCIELLLDAGYGHVICRGVLPEGANLFPVANANIQTAVDTVDDPKVVFLDTSLWSGIERVDSVTPTFNGYRTLANYATPAYAQIIGLLITEGMYSETNISSVTLIPGNDQSVTPAEMSVDSYISSPLLTVSAVVSPSNVVVGYDIESPSIVAGESIDVDDLAVVSAVDITALVQSSILAADDLSVQPVIDPASLLEGFSISPSDAVCVSSVDNVDLAIRSVVSAQSISVSSAIDSSSLIYDALIDAHSISIITTIDNLIFSGGVIPRPPKTGIIVDSGQFIITVQS